MILADPTSCLCLELNRSLDNNQKKKKKSITVHEDALYQALSLSKKDNDKVELFLVKHLLVSNNVMKHYHIK